MDIHVINLDRNRDRLSSFTAANRHLSNIRRFQAVDGDALPRAQPGADGVFSAEMPSYSNGAIGCALSHVALWRKAAEQSEPCTIAEDDAIFNIAFEAEADALLRSLPPGWDVVLWGWNFDSILLFDFLPGVSPCLATFDEAGMREHTAVFQELPVKPRAYRLRTAFGILAYTLSPQGARNLLRHCLPIREGNIPCPGLDAPVPNFGIDVVMSGIYGHIHAFAAFPPLAISKNEKAISTVNRQDTVPEPEMEPGRAGAHVNLANALQAAGKFDLAIAHYRKALHLDPAHAIAYNNLGCAILGAQGDLDEAAACFEQAIALMPDYPEAHNNLAHAARAQCLLDEAAACCRRAIELRPDRADFHNEFGNTLKEQGKLAAAAECYERAIALNSNFAEAHYNLGNLCGDQGRVDDALACYEQAIAAKPDHADAHTNLVLTLREQGRIEEAMQRCERALAVCPGSAAVNFSHGFLRLLTGDLLAGWPGYEWRWLTREAIPHGLTAPLWDGKDLGGRTILLHCEQGLGDNIQAIRFARLVKENRGTVLLSCPPSLTRLFQDVAGIDGLFPYGRDLPGYHVQAPLMSLPGLFQTRLDTIPSHVPYLQLDPVRVDVWKRRLADYPGFRVGIVWRGSPAHDRHRLMTASQFAGFLDIPGLAVISLQKDGTAGEVETLGRLPGPFLDAGPWLDDFSDTAALIANLDLVISVCTSVCHLAGSLAAPVWTLIPFAADWRWLLHREDSPWYPTMRLFRQPKIGDWESVMERVRAGLVSMAERTKP